MTEKARVEPIKRMAVPKLELQAAVHTNAQLAQFFKDQADIRIQITVLRSDSTKVWIRTPEIRHCTETSPSLGRFLCP